VTRRSLPTRLATRLATCLGGLLLLGGLAACGGGSDDSAAGTASGLDAVSISGDFGSQPKVTWKDQLVAKKLESKTLTEGDGDKVGADDQVFVRMYLGNGYSKSEAYSTFGKGASADLLPAASQLSPALKEAVEGHTIGSRVAVTSPPKDAFGANGNPQLGIGNEDSVLFVVDLESLMPSQPHGTDATPAGWAPAIVGDENKPTALDFSGTPKPKDRLRTTYLVKGDGAKTKDGQTIYVNYVGQVYDGKKPFDSSFSRGEPFSFELGAGKVIKGWDQAFSGVPVGSRIIVAVPPELGYGKSGNQQAGIQGTDTLYFLVDVLAAV
jgi:peptidylprolyl isomerase